MTVEVSPARRTLFNTLLKVPRRAIGPLVAEYRRLLGQDPYLGARALAYIAQTSKIRDQRVAAIVALIQSGDPEFREAARCLLLGGVYDIATEGIYGLEPFLVLRVLKFMDSPVAVLHGTEEIERFATERDAQKALPRIARRLTRKARAVSQRAAAIEPGHLIVRRDAGHVHAWRFLKALAKDYGNFLRAHPKRLDGIAVLNRRELEWMFRRLGSGPERAATLESMLPADSKLAAVKAIARMADPAEKAKAVIQSQIPFDVAAGLESSQNTAYAIALIAAMTPNQARNARAAVERSGLLDIPEVKAEYLKKIARATSSAASIEGRKSAQGTDIEVHAAMQKAKDQAAQQEGVQKDVVVLVDVSGSMTQGIEMARTLVPHVAARVKGELHLIAFNDMAMEVPLPDTSLSGVQIATRHLRPGGGTRIDAAIQYAVNKGWPMDALVVITDGEEYGDASAVVAGMADPPQVIVLGVGRYAQGFAARFENRGLPVVAIEANTDDYYALDAVVTALGKGKASLLQTILDTALPHRQGWRL